MDDRQKRLLEELLFSGEKRLSFTKLLFFGAFHTSSVFPFPVPSVKVQAETDDLLARLKAFAERSIDAQSIDHQAALPQAVIRGLGELGLLGLTIPKEYGGMGMSQYTYCEVMAELACHCGSSALFVNAHQSIGLKALVLFGTEAQKRRWLPPLARGEMIAAFSLTEQNAGSDASAVETRAVYDPEKRIYRLTGEKQWTTNGSMAGVLTVMAQTEMQTPEGVRDKITAFLVTPDMPGFKVTEKSLEKVGFRGTWTANLRFENVEVPEENILGPKGAGLRVALTVLDYGRTTFGSTCAGPARYCVDRAIEHARTRVQFNRPLATFPLIKKKIATIAALTYAMEATTMLTAGMVDRGMEDFMLEAAVLKVFNSESLWTILYETMQIYGGRSFFTLEPFERMMRDARLNMIGEGANEVLRAFISVVGMRDVGLQLKSVTGALRHPLAQAGVLRLFAGQCLGYLVSPKIPVRSAELRHQARALSRLVRRFGVAVVRLLSRYREEIVEQQLALDRIASAVIAIYTISATLSRMDAELGAGKVDAKKLQDNLASAKFYCQMALAQANSALGHIFDPTDQTVETTSDQLTRKI